MSKNTDSQEPQNAFIQQLQTENDATLEKKILVGCEEWCAFPGLGIPAVVARVDSGARTSSIHAFNIQPFTRKGQAWVSFEVHPLQDNRRILVRCEAPVYDYRRVKSSSGVAEKRYVIQTLLRLWDHEFLIELTLANRDSMGYRMLLGREAMVGRIMVDPQLSCCLGAVSQEVLDQHYKDARRSVDGLRIALLAEREKLYTNRRLIEACEERGHFPALLNPRTCFITVGNAKGEICDRDRGVIPAYDAMIPRFAMEDTLFCAGILRQYIAGGGVSFNGPEALLLCRDKLRLLQILVKHDIPVCSFGVAYSTSDLPVMADRLNATSFRVQLLNHYEVKSSFAIHSHEEVLLVSKAWSETPNRVQVFDAHQALEGVKVRVLVIAGRVVAAIEFEGHGVSSDHAGNDVCVLTKEEKRFTQKVAKISGLMFLAVEIFRSSEHESGCVLSDIIASPSIELFEKATGKDLATQVIVEIERCCDWQQQKQLPAGS